MTMFRHFKNLPLKNIATSRASHLPCQGPFTIQGRSPSNQRRSQADMEHDGTSKKGRGKYNDYTAAQQFFPKRWQPKCLRDISSYTAVDSNSIARMHIHVGKMSGTCNYVIYSVTKREKRQIKIRQFRFSGIFAQSSK